MLENLDYWINSEIFLSLQQSFENDATLCSKRQIARC